MTKGPRGGSLDDGRLWGESLPLSRRYGLVLLDLDGVVYLLGEPIDGVPGALRELRRAGAVPVFVTNNASRRAAEVAELLSAKGVEASVAEVRTSAQVAAALLAEHCEPGSRVLVVGSEALAEEVAEAGLTPVESANGRKVAAVVQGYGRTVTWQRLAEAVVAVREGAWWLASNTDKTMPSPLGPLPGNGTLVAAVGTALGRQPDAVAGKPAPAMLRQAVAAHPGRDAIMVGDRWDTDIAGAHAAGLPGLLVLSGSISAPEVLELPPQGRPQFLAWTVAGINEPHPPVRVEAGEPTRFRCRDWSVSVTDGKSRLAGDGDALDALRALAQAAWWSRDRDAGVAGTPVADGESAARALARLGF
ncbi:HAD-IIA family hydrolase [Stackebrandtia nassauensis]|uniref:HAD-superfamily hydrolase, subfamily IIA n=1 Tax=Stackebrandtia nassauensis (strain DSM 44728 / CIP 108903 / NRRL B-16338 / NBRC 102104 / LLR-40K-21) TaxID=446470 RepID=D3Q539_STANL|nr:HAD-IIA family hydrolase [Stackebrandtia nassauensis]ADD44088.1 HAD-superfamily hydrolase, subfamily IIA [Stackebrandtia nassauensis DSM 44728]